MAIIRRIKNSNFTTISNHCLRRDDISWKAKGIYAYLMSLPDDWVLYKGELVTHATDGKDSTNSGFAELTDAGYITATQVRNESGQLSGWDYDIFEYPYNESPSEDSPKAGNPQSVNPISVKPPLLKTKPKQKTNKTKTEEFPSLLSLVSDFNAVTGRKVKVLGSKATKQYKALLRSGVTHEDVIAAAKNCAENEFFLKKGNLRYLTPEYITRADKFSVYFDDKPVKADKPKRAEAASV